MCHDEDRYAYPVGKGIENSTNLLFVDVKSTQLDSMWFCFDQETGGKWNNFKKFFYRACGRSKFLRAPGLKLDFCEGLSKLPGRDSVFRRDWQNARGAIPFLAGATYSHGCPHALVLGAWQIRFFKWWNFWTKTIRSKHTENGTWFQRKFAWIGL